MTETICPLCHDTGWQMYVDEKGCWFQRECKCGILEKKKLESQLRFANLPETFKDKRLKSFSLNSYQKPESKNCLISSCKAIKHYLDNFDRMKELGNGLYLFSITKGSGKTHMAACIANELIYEKHISVKFSTSMQILDEIKNTYGNRDNSGYTENKLLDALVTAPVLLIDDFGAEKVRDWANEKFYSIINGRYVEKKITIFTSNMNLNDLSYDDRITNRIKERCYLIPFPEESIRDGIAEKLAEEMKGAIT